MDTQQQPCNTERIERFLADRLNGQELAEFENHLDTCESCRRELEARAADPSWWCEVRDCLAEGATSADLDSSAGGSADVVIAGGGGTRSWPGDAEGRAQEAEALLAAIKPYLAPTDDPRMLGRVGSYEIVGLIGSGGNGVVLKGFDGALHRYVAIKLLSPRLADSGAARRRFSREAQAAAAVVHDNVMAIHAVSETQGLPFLVMPYVRGPSLEKRLRASGPLAVAEILRVGMQVAAGLAAAHAQGLVHRDIKPANILLEEGVERVKITDFGLARAADDASLTRSGVIAGTPQYMSPEQARGEPVDHRADLFSLGCVLYAAATGHSPFRAETSYGVLRKICESEPRNVCEINATVPAWLARIIARLLAKDPAQRFASSAEVSTLLERCLAHVQQPAAVGLPAELLDAPSRRRLVLRRIARIGPGRLGLVALLVLAVTLLALKQRGPARQQERPARAAGTPAPSVSPGSDKWGDGIAERIDELAADVDRMSGRSSDELWNDSIGARIEDLQADMEDLRAQLNDGKPSQGPPESRDEQQ